MTNCQATALPYRIYRAGTQLTSAVFADEGEHNVAVARRLWHEHRLRAGDVLVMELRCGEATAPIAYRFERDGRPVAIQMPEEVRK